MPRFLDLAFTFGEQIAEKDFHYTAFNAENFLDVSSARKHCIPRLGRSGREIKHCFNLWSVEESETSPYGWAIRQTAAYHSFDVCTGRNVWINMKGNELMQKRITQALGSTSHLQPVDLKTASGSFSVSLLTLLIVLEWSGENWKSLINELEKQLSDILMKAKSAPFKKIEEALSLDPDILLENLTATEATAGKLPRRTDSGVQIKPPPRTETIRSAWSSVTPKRILSGFSRASTSVDTEKQDSPVLAKTKTPPEPLKSLLKSPTLQQTQLTSGPIHQSKFSVLQEFTVDGLQKLTTIASKIHELKLVMKLNAEVINEIIDYYKTLVEGDGFQDIKTNCTTDLNDFFRRARAVIRGLEMEQSRSGTLMRMFEDGKSLVSEPNQPMIKQVANKLHLVRQYSSISQHRDQQTLHHQCSPKRKACADDDKRYAPVKPRDGGNDEEHEESCREDGNTDLFHAPHHIGHALLLARHICRRKNLWVTVFLLA